MSLDVYLIRTDGPCPTCGRGEAEEYLYDANITHNLHQMAAEAGLECVWSPQETGITKAGDLIEPLIAGITIMEANPERFRQLEPENKWGTYRDFVPWLKEYLQACRDYPEASVRVSR